MVYNKLCNDVFKHKMIFSILFLTAEELIMKPLYLSITDNRIMYSDSENTINENDYIFDLNLNLKKNLANLKNNLTEKFDLIIITNPAQYLLKKNIISFNNEIIDLGNELEDIFHIPVVNLQDVKDTDLHTAYEQQKHYTNWHLDYYGLSHKKRQYGQESMQTVGNGYLGLRGTYLEAKASTDYYPATYIAGVFNQLATPINERDVINEDLVNLPNAQYMTFNVNDDKYFVINEQNVQESLRSLDMHNGILTITLLVKLDDGKELKITEQKLADLKNYHDFYLKYSIQPLNFSGNIKILTQIDGSIENSNVERYRNLAKKHLSVDKIENIDKSTYLFAHTNQSKVNLAVKTTLNCQNIINPFYQIENSAEIAQQTISFAAKEREIYSIEKAVSFFTSLETSTDLDMIIHDHTTFNNFDEVYEKNSRTWKQFWKKENVSVTGDVTAQKLLRLNSYSMSTAAQTNANQDLDTSVGSRGLTGEGYRGHIFWDELFDINFYVLHSPKLVKSLLMYRYNRLKAAIDYAFADGHNGAMYPWQSGMYGDEQSQLVHLNPITNTWDPDNSRKQRHVSLAVAYNVINYYNVSEDEEFMKQYGLEMLLRIAEFWIDMAKLDDKTGKYTISNIMGPDEFHEGYPGHEDDGLKNNAYTNIMVSWLFKKLLNFVQNESNDTIDDNFQRANFSADDLQKLDDISNNLKLDFQGDILGQFEGYFDLKKLDFEKYRKQYGNISRMDRILKAHDDTPDNYQVAKQADTLMALFNMREDDFLNIMNDLGYPIASPEKFIEDNIKYYIARTTHGSTLSRIVYSMLLLKVGDSNQAWKLFYEALTSDYYDIQGGTTAEGIHLGVMGATLNVVTSFFAGVDYRGNILEINPHIPEQWKAISFRMTFKKINFKFKVVSGAVTIKADQDTEVNFVGKRLPLTANQAIELTY